MQQPQLDLAPVEQWFTVKELAIILKLSERTVATLIRKRVIPSIKIAGSRRVSLEALRDLAKLAD
jgi:excisionase family DNA binding protein